MSNPNTNDVTIDIPTQSKTQRFLTTILWMVAFCLAYTQSPLYTSNQNQYFLHGMAKAGVGLLDQDWLANTEDPTPLFSFLVFGITKYLHPILFYLVYAALMSLYLVMIIRIIELKRKDIFSKQQAIIFLSVIVIIHSAGWRFFISRIIDPEWSYFIEDGFAGQRMLGPVLQPSSFGVLLLLSIFFILKNRKYAAILAACTAALFHPTYLLSAAILVSITILGYAWENRHEWDRKHTFKLVAMGFFALLVISPILVYTFRSFGSPSAITDQSRNILITFRIPHHAIIEEWFNYTSVIKLVLIFLGLILTWRTRLFTILLIPTVVGLVLTVYQLISGSQLFSLIFPWRMSIFLVPISTAVLVERSIMFFSTRNEPKRWHVSKLVVVISLSLTFIAVASGVTRMFLDFQRKSNSNEYALFQSIKAGDYPQSTIFVTPLKMQDFRLETGLPVYVDFKSIPYDDADVLEWYRRNLLVDEFYKDPTCGRIENLGSNESVTHIVLPISSTIPECEGTKITKMTSEFFIL